MVLVPSILHIPPHIFARYPRPYQEKTRLMLIQLIAGGWAGNTRVIDKD